MNRSFGIERVIVIITLITIVCLPVIHVAMHRNGSIVTSPWISFVMIGIILIITAIIATKKPSTPSHDGDRYVLMCRAIRSMVLPFIVVAIIPSLIIYTSDVRPHKSMFVSVAVVWSIGLGLMITTIDLFFNVGEGSLGPFDPPTRFIARGPYRYQRNPMISGSNIFTSIFSIFYIILFILCATGVLCLVGSETLLYLSHGIGIWWVIFLIVNTVAFKYWEEPQLAQRFGDSYHHYLQHVNRWWPRLSPYVPLQQHQQQPSRKTN